MIDERATVSEIPLGDLYPTVYINGEVRQKLDGYLRDWLKKIDVIRKESPDEAEIIEALLKDALCGIDGYNAFDTEGLKKPKKLNQDSFLKEWVHEIRSFFMRTNSVKGKDKLFYLSGFEVELSESLSEETLMKLDNRQRSSIHLQAINAFVSALSETNEQGRLAHNTRDSVPWWDNKKITLNPLINSTATHIAGHVFLMQPFLLEQNGVLPPLYNRAPQLTKIS